MKKKNQRICIAAFTLFSMFLFIFSHYRTMSYEPVIPKKITEYEVIDPKSQTARGEKDINEISENELSEIDGIGESTARKIIDYREKTGGFSSLDEVTEIDGIGEKTLERLRAYFSANNSDKTEITTTVSDTSDEYLSETAASGEIYDKPDFSGTEPIGISVSESETERKIETEAETTATETTAPYAQEDAEEIIYIDISTADENELVKLKGIGPATAKKIIEYREENKGFSEIEELMNVSGIGEKRFEAIKNNIYISAPKKTAEKNTHEEKNTEYININTADKEMLMTLSGIGEVIAERIIDYREEKGGFSSVEEIKNVTGIGDKTFDKIKDRICV